VLVRERDDEPRLRALDRAENGRRVAPGDELAADGGDRQRDEVGRADDVEPERRLGGLVRLAVGFGLVAEQPPTRGEAEGIDLDGARTADGASARPRYVRSLRGRSAR
jgi:hypothetical protein